MMTELINSIGPIPPGLEALIEEYAVQPVTIGCSSASVFYLQAPNKPNLYLKIIPQNSEETFRPEVERLEWLKDQLPVPQVLYYRQTDAGEYLLLSEIAGLMACDESFNEKPARLVKLLAEGLKRLHSLDISQCPFDGRIDSQLEAARQRIQAGLVDETDFDEKRRGLSATALFEELLRTRPGSEDVVFSHGDYCLPNVILDPSGPELNGFIDLGRSGLADRYQDLALAARSLEFNCGPEFVPALFEEYSLKEVDWAKIEFFQLLDEFF